jgi:hypothetical protein
MKNKLYELISGAAVVLLFDGFIIWALFLAPAHMAI